MSDPRAGEGQVRNTRQAKIPADKDSVWEDGSGDEARSRRRDDVEGAIRVTEEGTPVRDATGGSARGSSRTAITRSSGSAAKKKRKAARRLK